MTFRHLAIRAIGIAVLGAATGAAVAQAGGQARSSNDQAPPSGAVLKNGNLVEFCADGGGCRTSRHPLAAGTVRQIVPGDFIRAAQASWIAMGDRAVNLCYLADTTAAITCTPIANGAELTKGMQVEYLDLDDGSGTLRFSPKAGDRTTAKATYNPYPFMSGVSAAAEILQKHAARHRGANATYAHAVLGGGGGADVCAFADGGGVTCTGTQGEAPREESDHGADRGAAAPAAFAAAARQPDPYAIATVNTGRRERPTLQSCTTAAITQMKECNDPRKNLGDEGHRACLADSESTLQECTAEVRYNANPNR